MKDRFERNINYLRISVTDRCNLRCQYCMPAEGITMMEHKDILTLEEIADVVRVGVEQLGIERVRLTGGEPLVRKGIVDLVGLINDIPGIKEINLTTNGILLAKYAQDLKHAGLTRVNISLDTLSADKFRTITRGGNIDDVMEGIYAAKTAELTPVKINVVKMESSDNDEIARIKKFCKKEDLKIQFINQMNLQTGSFSQVDGGNGGNCSICNRLRLTANGNLKPCLFSDEAYNVKELGILEAYHAALDHKPEKGYLSKEHEFYNIGG